MKKKYLPWKKDEKIRIAIMFQVASYWPSIESFYEECMRDPDVDVRIFYVDDLAVEKAQIKDTVNFLESTHMEYKVYSEECLVQFHPHIALYQPPYDVTYRNPSALSLHLMNKGIRIMYIPYGIEIADTPDARWAHFHTYVIRNSWRIYTFSKMILQEYQMYCSNRHAVRATGSPKFDAIRNKDIPLDDSIYRQAAGRKIVVWKMHFPKIIYDGIKKRQVTPELSEYLKFADQIASYEDLFFVVMPHPLFFSVTISEDLAKQSQKLFEVLKAKSNVIIDLTPDYRNSLYNADAIIVDRSALMVEAGLRQVPVLYMRNQEYDEPLTKAVECLVRTYEQGTTAEDMLLFLDRFSKKELDTSIQKRTTVIEETMPFLDGNSGKRIVEDIKKSLENEAEEGLRVVFFGAGVVCDHYVKRLNILNDKNFVVLGLADNSPDKWGTMHAGMEVMPPEQLKDLDFDVLVITTEQYHLPIKQKLVYELFLDEDKILRLDVFCEKYFM